MLGGTILLYHENRKVSWELEEKGGRDGRISSWASWRERPLATQAMIIYNKSVGVQF
jgi:hypothetical protein